MKNRDVYASKFALLICLLLCGIQLSAQSSWMPDRYYGINERDKTPVFVDDFSDNRHNWNLQHPSMEIEIANEDLLCRSLDKSYVKQKEIEVDASKDYELEIRFRYLDGPDNVGNGLTFGRDPAGNEYNIYITPKGKYNIYKSEDHDITSFTGWKECSYLNQYSYNTISIRSVQGTWYIFFNRLFVHKMPAQEWFGQGFGFSLSGNVGIKVDYLKAKQLQQADISAPSIIISYPNLSQGSTVTVSEGQQVIEGQVYDASGVKEVLINNHTVDAKDGNFMAVVDLPEGNTRIEVKAIDYHNNTNSQSFILKYDPRRSAGTDYLLLIGVNQYDHWSELRNAVKDCRDIGRTLVDGYQFEPENMMTLFDHQATRENILETLEDLQERVTENDNVVIYYAGHGYYDASSKLGYWVPVDARKNKIPDYIRNSTIQDYVKIINSHHTLVIADACYAGTLFSRGRSIINANNKSRWAFTSGNIEKVWDGEPGANSPFAKYLIKFLGENDKPELQADELIEAVKLAVKRNTEQTPVGNPLQNVGDEGGVFVFRKRR